MVIVGTDMVIDLHSGGSSLYCVPFAMTSWVEGNARNSMRLKVLEALGLLFVLRHGPEAEGWYSSSASWRAGAAGFAAAWDTALGVAHDAVDLASTKATGLAPYERMKRGLVQVWMHRGRYRGSTCKPDINALLQHHAAMERAARMLDESGRELSGLEPADRVNARHPA